VKNLDLQFVHEYKEGLRVCIVSRSKTQLNGSQGNGNSSQDEPAARELQP
jgi:hypothetical protein